MNKSKIAIIAIPFIIFVVGYNQYPNIVKWLHNNEYDQLLERANEGNKVSQYTLGTYYEFGGGVPVDKKKAVDFYKMAAAQGHAAAIYSLGRLYKTEPGLFPIIPDRSPSDISRELIEKAANLGNEHAQCDLGTMYENGDGVPQDLKKALERYTQSADQNYGPALIKLADFYRLGIGVEKNSEKAVELLIKATKLGTPERPAYPEAYSILSIMYETGEGVPTDKEKALDYRKKSEKFKSK